MVRWTGTRCPKLPSISFLMLSCSVLQHLSSSIRQPLISHSLGDACARAELPPLHPLSRSAPYLLRLKGGEKRKRKVAEGQSAAGLGASDVETGGPGSEDSGRKGDSDSVYEGSRAQKFLRPSTAPPHPNTTSAAPVSSPAAQSAASLTPPSSKLFQILNDPGGLKGWRLRAETASQQLEAPNQWGDSVSGEVRRAEEAEPVMDPEAQDSMDSELFKSQPWVESDESDESHESSTSSSSRSSDMVEEHDTNFKIARLAFSHPLNSSTLEEKEECFTGEERDEGKFVGHEEQLDLAAANSTEVVAFPSGTQLSQVSAAMLHEAESLGLPLTPRLYDKVLQRCFKTHNLEDGLAVYEHMRNNSIPLSVTGFETLLALLEANEDWHLALELSQTVFHQGLAIDRSIYLRLIHLTSKIQEWEVVKALYSEMRENFFIPDGRAYDEVLEACRRTNSTVLARRVLQSIKSTADRAPSDAQYSVVIKTLAEAGLSAEAEKLMDEANLVSQQAEQEFTQIMKNEPPNPFQTRTITAEEAFTRLGVDGMHVEPKEQHPENAVMWPTEDGPQVLTFDSNASEVPKAEESDRIDSVREEEESQDKSSDMREVEAQELALQDTHPRVDFWPSKIRLS